MENSENQEIGELLAGIIANGFRVNIFQVWKIHVGTVESLPVENPWDVPEPVPTPGPKIHIGIESNELREKPEFNQRYLKADTLIDALRKTAKVAQFIVDTSKPVR